MSGARFLGPAHTPQSKLQRAQSRERARGAPGKRTLTQSLSRPTSAPPPALSAPVQRQGKTLAELTDDPWMDVAHRGAAADAFDAAPVQAKGDLPTAGHEGAHRAAAQGTAGPGERLPFLDCPGGATCGTPGAGQDELSEEDAAEQGRQALQLVGYEELIEMAVAAGLVRPPGREDAPVQRQAAAAAATFGEVFSPWATAAAISSQADSPAPGPGDLVALGILAVGLIAAGYTVLMAAPGNQADTGILDQAHELIRAGAASGMCAALALLMEQARRAGDSTKMQRIKKTQKAKGCRHSRHS